MITHSPIKLGMSRATYFVNNDLSGEYRHTISNVPIGALNRLESLTLVIFNHNLTVSSRDWSQWLSHVMSYHMSLTSPTHPQPISRPSANPHSIVRKALEEIIQAPAACNSCSSIPQPVFLGLEERREKLEKEKTLAVDVLEIDLDEDGPLREEYLPKRRVSAEGNRHYYHPRESNRNRQVFGENASHWDRRNVAEVARPLPPPAKWSPAADEPLIRERNRIGSQYVAVRPPLVNHIAPYSVPYHQGHSAGYTPHDWNSNVAYAPAKPQLAGYYFDPLTINLHNATQPTYNPYTFVPHIAMSHSRSQSLYDQDNIQSHNHMRSYSQSRFEYQCSDIRMTANELAHPNEHDAQWTAAGHYPYPAHTFAPPPNAAYQSAWLRT